MKLLITIIVLLSVISLKAQDPSTSNKRAYKYFQNAQNYYHLRENQHAIEQLEQALMQDERFVDAMLLMADIYHELGKDSLQISYLERALELGSDHTPKIAYVLGSPIDRKNRILLGKR